MVTVQACPDSSGDEIVVLPFPYSSHNYKIRVSTWEGVRRSVSACSPKFEIRARERPNYSTPSPTSLNVEDQVSIYPLTPGTYRGAGYVMYFSAPATVNAGHPVSFGTLCV